MTIGQRIAQKRKELGLSQEALGEQLGVSRQAIYKWESDATLPEIENLIALSRSFEVSVGWLLGEEDLPSPSGNLTEDQLRMVQEIVDRYLTARAETEANEQTVPSWQVWPEAENRELSPEQLRFVQAVALRVQDSQTKQEIPKRRRWPWAIAIAACLAIIIALFSLSEQLRSLDNQTHYLQSTMQMLENSMANQISSITGRVEEILKSQNDLTADYSTQVTAIDKAGTMATFSFRAVPKTYQSGMVAWIDIVNEGAHITFGPYEAVRKVFSGEFTVALTDSTTIYIVFELDGIRQTQLLGTYENLYRNSFPQVYLDAWPLSFCVDDNTNALTEPLDARLANVLNSGSLPLDLNNAGVHSFRVGLFADQELVAWFTPGTYTVNHETSSGMISEILEEHSLSPDGITLDRSKVYCIAAVVMDQYGREFVVQDTPVRYQAGEGWTGTGTYTSGPFFDGWTY